MKVPRLALVTTAVALVTVLLLVAGALYSERERRIWAESELQELRDELEDKKLCLKFFAGEVERLKLERETGVPPENYREIRCKEGSVGLLIFDPLLDRPEPVVAP